VHNPVHYLSPLFNSPGFLPPPACGSQLSRNRNLTTIYLDLVTMYIRVLKMFELIEDRAAIASLFTAAYNVSPDADKDMSATRTNKYVRSP
jgi:hypothetical protein